MTEEVKIEQSQETQTEQQPDIKTEENKENWRKFREQREADRKALKEAQELAKRKEEEAKALKEAMDAILSKPQPENYNDYEEDEEKKVQKLVEESLKRERQRLEQERKEKESKELPTRLRAEYPDFDKVCNQENLDYFEYSDPDSAKAFQFMPDSFDKWSAIYRKVKKTVPYANKQEDQKKIEQNATKPQSPNAVITEGEKMGTPWKMTEQRRMENWRRMQAAMKSMD